MEKKITMKQLLSKFDVKLINGDEQSELREVTIPEINRPGLELAGFFKHSDFRRIIIIGDKEYAFIQEMSVEDQYKVFEEITKPESPGIVICKGNEAPGVLKEIAYRKNYPLYETDLPTGRFSIALLNEMEELLAPETLMHGVFLNIYGKGVIIKGDSGIGKSEISLDLIKRGHLFVADDAIELVNLDGEIYGKAPKVLANLLEIRGIGVIDVSKMFGISSVLDGDQVDLIIQLDRWVPSKEYKRISVEDDGNVEDILGVDIDKVVIPVSSGRNMSVIIESAVMNMRLQEYGVDSSQDFVNRVINKIDNGGRDL